MTAIDQIRAADTVRFDGIGYNLLGRAGTATPPCKTKRVGHLEFTLNVRDFGLEIDQELPFTGTPDDSSQTITWNIDISTNISQGPVHVSRIHGQFLTRASEHNPSLGQACDGANRVYDASFAIMLDPGRPEIRNQIQIDYSVADGWGGGGTQTLDLISGNATTYRALIRSFAEVWLSADTRSPNVPERVYFARVGETLSFTVHARWHNLNSPIRRQDYSWTVSGATPGPEDRFRRWVSFNTPGVARIEVLVTGITDVDNVFGSASLTMPVYTQEQVEMGARLRQLFDHLYGNFYPLVVQAKGAGPGFRIGDIIFRDPLWDPDYEAFLAPQHALLSLYQLQNNLKLMAGSASKALDATEEVIKYYEAQFSSLKSKE